MTKTFVICIIACANLAATCDRRPVGFPKGEDCTVLTNSILCTDPRRETPPDGCVVVNGPDLTYECPIDHGRGYQCTSPKDYEIRLKWVLNHCKMKEEKLMDETSGEEAMDGHNLPQPPRESRSEYLTYFQER